jgi:hypothetical protein
LIIGMQGGEKLSKEKIRVLLEASEGLRFAGHSREEIYAWVEATMNQHGYRKQSRDVKAKAYRRYRFASNYTRGDIEQQAIVDEAHETTIGGAPVSAAEEQAVPPAPCAFHQDQTNGGCHRRTPASSTGGAYWISSRGHGAPKATRTE